MHTHSIGVACVAIGLCCVLTRSAVAQTPTVRTIDPVSVSDVSGYRGTVTWVGAGTGDMVMSGVQWREQDDKPCVLTIGTYSLSDIRSTTHRYVEGNSINICRNFHLMYPMQSDDNSYRQARFSYMNSSTVAGVYAVRGVRVCSTSADNHRLKGVMLFRADISIGTQLFAGPVPEPRVDAENATARAEQSNCANWKQTVYCPAGQVASGLAVHVADDAIVGLALRCRRVST